MENSVYQWLTKHGLNGARETGHQERKCWVSGNMYQYIVLHVDLSDLEWAWEDWERFWFSPRPRDLRASYVDVGVCVETPEYPKGSQFPPAVAGDKGASGRWLRNPEDEEWNLGPRYLRISWRIV